MMPCEARCSHQLSSYYSRELVLRCKGSAFFTKDSVWLELVRLWKGNFLTFYLANHFLQGIRMTFSSPWHFAKNSPEMTYWHFFLVVVSLREKPLPVPVRMYTILKNKCLQRRGPWKCLGRQGLHSVKDQNVFVSQVHVDPPSSEAGHPSGPSQVGHPRDLVPVFSGLGSKPGPHKIHPGLGKMGLHKR